MELYACENSTCSTGSPAFISRGKTSSIRGLQEPVSANISKSACMLPSVSLNSSWLESADCGDISFLVSYESEF